MKEIDQKIIDVMRENARISITDISKITEVPDTTIHFRLKKLKDILNYRLTLNHKKLGENYYLLEIIPIVFPRWKPIHQHHKIVTFLCT